MLTITGMSDEVRDQAKVRLAAAYMLLANVPMVEGYAKMTEVLDMVQGLKRAFGKGWDTESATKASNALRSSGLL